MREYDIYFAAPLFTSAERQWNIRLEASLRNAGIKVFLPQEECKNAGSHEIASICFEGISNCHLMLAILDGPDADSGTCVEVGYAWAKGIPIFGLRTDFRDSGEHSGVNLMLVEACYQIFTEHDLVDGLLLDELKLQLP